VTAVLFLTESFHPVLGGGEQHILRLGRALAASGMEATVVTRRGDPQWPAEEDVDGIRVVRVRPTGPARRGKYAMVPAAIAAVRRLRATYDVLVVRGTRVLGLPALLAARALGKGIVLQAEVNGEMTGEVYTWGTRFDRGFARRGIFAGVAARNVLLRDADAFVAMSRAIRDEFLAAGVVGQKVATIPHGVDVARFQPASPAEQAALRARLGLPIDGRIVLYAGRLLRGKGLDTLLTAFREVARADASAHLVIAGDGAGQALSVETDVHAAARGEGLAGRVSFPGRVDAVEDWLRAADVFAFPSLYEALGIALVEAAACGLPAVASRTGGIVDVVEDGRSGLLVPPGDAAALAAGLRRLVADNGLARAMGQSARTIALARFDERDAVTRYRALFTEVAGRARSA
jgi:glycosyltransferase involved in cell wall biosynthesis